MAGAHYLDTSAFLKLVVAEPESHALLRRLRKQDADLVSSELMRVEALPAARHHSPDALAQARSRLDVVALMAVTGAACERAVELAPSITHSLDAVHLASSLMLGDQLAAAVTYDQQLAHACAAHGVRVEAPAP